jgi:hypothetical protein
MLYIPRHFSSTHCKHTQSSIVYDGSEFPGFLFCFAVLQTVLSQQNHPLKAKVMVNSQMKFIGSTYYSLSRDSVVRRSNPGGVRFSTPIQTGSGAYPNSCTMGTGSFPGVKAAGA